MCVVVNMAYASASGSKTPIPVNSDILQMLAEIQTEPTTMESLDKQPEIDDDFKGNPVQPNTVMTVGKYKG